MPRYRWHIDRSPFISEFAKIQGEMSRLWDTHYYQESSSRGLGLLPLVNIWEDHDNFFLSAEIPGVDEKDLEITAVSDNITIKGERRADTDEEANYHRLERNGGKFSRVIRLGDHINSDKVEAHLKNGVLGIVIGKADEAKPKQITIKTS